MTDHAPEDDWGFATKKYAEHDRDGCNPPLPDFDRVTHVNIRFSESGGGIAERVYEFMGRRGEDEAKKQCNQSCLTGRNIPRLKPEGKMGHNWKSVDELQFALSHHHCEQFESARTDEEKEEIGKGVLCDLIENLVNQNGEHLFAEGSNIVAQFPAKSGFTTEKVKGFMCTTVELVRKAGD